MNISEQINKVFRTKHGMLYILLACVWGQPLLSFANGFGGKFFGEIGGYSSYVINTIIVLISLPALLKTINGRDFLLYWLFVLVYFLQGVFFPENAQYLIDYSFIVLICTIPVYFVGCCCDINKVDKLFYILSIAFVVFQFIYSFFYLSTHESNSFDYEETEHMGTAYSLLAFTLYLIWCAFRKPSIINIGASLLGGFQILTCGVRTPFLFLFIFIVLYVLFFADIKKSYKVITIVLLGLSGAVAVYYSDYLTAFLLDVLGNAHMSDRIVQRIVNEELMDSGGRFEIFEQLNKALSNSGVLGLGIFGSWNITGLYAHNIILDLWCSFGYLIGSVLLVVIIGIIIKAYIVCSKFERQFLLILIFMGFLQLFVSNFFLFNSHFYLLMGYCIGRIRKFQL